MKEAPPQLAAGCTVADYRRWEASQDRGAIALFMRARFEQRYLTPIQIDPRRKHGFTMMAVSCLMIEALESFFRGWGDTRGKSERAFVGFFKRWDEFSRFRPVAGDFYRHVRCGILHQAETTGGWRIVRSGPVLAGKTVNATRFVRGLGLVIDAYATLLKEEAWEAPLWTAFRKKMDAICRNAGDAPA